MVPPRKNAKMQDLTPKATREGLRPFFRPLEKGELSRFFPEEPDRG